MIWFDVTKSHDQRHASGLRRVSLSLLGALGHRAEPVVWDGTRQTWVRPRGTLARLLPGQPVTLARPDWLLTSEVFAPEERAGFDAWLAKRPCRMAAIFHDAIPRRLPDITWPQSVARFPAYLRMLAACDVVLPVSAASAAEFLACCQEDQLTPPTPLAPLQLGADGLNPGGRYPLRQTTPLPHVLTVGIIEPRKNQGMLLDAAEQLWQDGINFHLHVVGRVNPHFGAPLAARLAQLAKREPRLHWHEAVDDETLLTLFIRARCTLFASRAEGCGLPLLESLWRAVPCLASDLPSLRENAAAGGCELLPVDDAAAWASALRRVLTDDQAWRALAEAAHRRPLTRWCDTADQVAQALASAAQ